MEVEAAVLAWLRQRHTLDLGLADILKKQMAGEATPPDALFADISEALDELEQRQSGLY